MDVRLNVEPPVLGSKLTRGLAVSFGLALVAAAGCLDARPALGPSPLDKRAPSAAAAASSSASADAVHDVRGAPSSSSGAARPAGADVSRPEGPVAPAWSVSGAASAATQDAPRPTEGAAPAQPTEVIIGGAKLVTSVAKKGGACTIEIGLVKPTGTPRDAELARELETLSVEYALGPWEPGEPPAENLRPLFAADLSDDKALYYGMGGGGAPHALRTFASHGRMHAPRSASAIDCPPGEPDVRILSSEVTLTSAGGDYAALQIVGYSRFNRVAAFVRMGCFLIDVRRGTVVSSREGLSWRPLGALAAAASRTPRDDIGAAAKVRIRQGTQLCVDPKGLRVQFQPGELDLYTSTVGPSVTLPKELARGLVPADTPLGRALH